MSATTIIDVRLKQATATRARLANEEVRVQVPRPPAIEVSDVSHRYVARDGSVTALEHVSLRIEEGAFVSLVGPSGCGKTTLMRGVAGLLPTTSGSIEVFGAPPTRAREQHTLGLMTQEPGLLPWRNVAGNVALSLELAGGAADRGTVVRGLLERVGIARFERFHPRELSGGMRQRVALARALAHGPRLLLMDEPFGSLDELSREELRLELLRIWERERVSVLFITHSIREAVLLSDRVVVMSRSPGRIVDDMAIELPRPREESMEQTVPFARYAERIRAALAPSTTAVRA
jgi:NitT/TauT family transport system ATP-binding protein